MVGTIDESIADLDELAGEEALSLAGEDLVRTYTDPLNNIRTITRDLALNLGSFNEKDVDDKLQRYKHQLLTFESEIYSKNPSLLYNVRNYAQHLLVALYDEFKENKLDNLAWKITKLYYSLFPIKEGINNNLICLTNTEPLLDQAVREKILFSDVKELLKYSTETYD